jgi:hypothetical protein
MAGPKGLGGWLILLGIGEVLAPLQIFTSMIMEYTGLPDGTIARLPLAFAGDLLIRLAMIGLCVWSAWLFFNKRAKFPKIFIVSTVAAFVSPLVLGAWVTLTSGVNTLANIPTPRFLGPYLFGIAVAMIWITYVLKSVRVKNTFVE